jgi:hypothetical protein
MIFEEDTEIWGEFYALLTSGLSLIEVMNILNWTITEQPVDPKARVVTKTTLGIYKDTYNEELGEELCRAVAEGMSFENFCKMHPGVYKHQIYKWKEDHPEFRLKLALAREEKAESYVDQIMDIADDKNDDILTNSQGSQIPNMASVQRAKLRIDNRKWYAGVVLPKIYQMLKQEGALTEEEDKRRSELIVRVIGGPTPRALPDVTPKIINNNEED